MTPSAAALSLFNSLPLPAGTVAVLPSTVDGQVTLVVTVDRRYWDRLSQIPKTHEGFAVVVEPPKLLFPQIA